MNDRNISVANLFGYSMGGYVALYLAKKEPERIHRISTLGTIVEWNEDKAMTETVYLHPEKMEDKVPHFAEVLRKRHKVDWMTLVNKTREMLEYLGRRPAIRKEEWRKLTQPVRMHIGDRDNTAGIESTIEVYNRLDNGELVVLPHTPHPFEKVNEQWLIYSLSEFFNEEPVNSRTF
jgi:pimeloyl-ACP methyl ester carboxylesterase